MEKGRKRPIGQHGGGGLDAQAQHLLLNLAHNIHPYRAQIAEVLRKRPQMSIASLVAYLCGVHRMTVRNLIERVDRHGQDAVRAPLVRAGPGRKRGRDNVEACTESSDNELPSLGDDMFSDAADEPPAVAPSTCRLGFAQQVAFDVGGVASVRHTSAARGSSSAAQGLPDDERVESRAPVIENKLPTSINALQTLWRKRSILAGSSLQGRPALHQDQTIGIRLGSLVASLIVQGLGTSAFPKWLHMLDAHFPGEWGQINHSKQFAERFADSLMRACARNVMEHVQQRVRALRVPSDYVRILDGITPQMGESLLIHVVISVSRGDGHTLKWSLLDLTPQGRTSPPQGGKGILAAIPQKGCSISMV